MLELLGMPPQASAHASQIDDMIVILHWLMLVLFVGWGIFFVYTLVRFRASAHPKANYEGVKSHASSYLEVAVAVVEAVILLAFAIPAWAVRVNAFPPEDGATVIHVIAKQFEWHSVYPGPDGRFGRRDARPDHPDQRDRSRPRRPERRRRHPHHQPAEPPG